MDVTRLNGRRAATDITDMGDADELRGSVLRREFTPLTHRILHDDQPEPRRRALARAAHLVKVMAALDFRFTGLTPGETLTEQLRTRRCRLSLSLDQAAARTGLSRATVAALERGDGTICSLLRLLSAIAPRLRRRASERA